MMLLTDKEERARLRMLRRAELLQEIIANCEDSLTDMRSTRAPNQAMTKVEREIIDCTEELKTLTEELRK